MKKFNYLLLLLMILSGCTVNKDMKQKSVDRSPKLEDINYLKSMVYYSCSEYMRLDGNYDAAFDLVRLAEENSPESVYLKEKIFDFLKGQARRDSTVAAYMIKLGSKWYESGYYSSKLLYNLAQACIYQGEIEQADKYFAASLGTDAKREQYLNYYLFRNRYYPPADTLLIHQAVAGEWKNESEDIIYEAIDIYKTLHEEKRARDLLVKSYYHWRNMQSLTNIVALNQLLNDWDSTIELLSDRQEKEADLPLGLFKYLISVYYDGGEYEKVIALEEKCRSTGDDMIMKMLFLSALQVGNYELSHQTADLLIAAGFIDDAYYPSFYGSLWELEMKAGKWTLAMEYFNKVENVLDKMGLIIGLMSDTESEVLLSEFLENYYQVTEDKPAGMFLLSIFNLTRGELKRGEELLSLVDNQYIKDNNLVAPLASAYEDKDIKFIISKFDGDNLLTGLMYYYLKDQEQALSFLEKAFESGELNSQGVLSLGSILVDRSDENSIISVLSWGIKHFPEDSDILNFYGYQIAVQKESELYPAAEESLIKALDMKPENAMYWDSLGWLYYRMGRYGDALNAMAHTDNIVTGYAEILYHYAAILYESQLYDEALMYLNLIDEFDNEKEWKKQAEELITLIKKIK
ncbi:MAG: hypothetical protein P9X26_10200 [Candidatus Stygibacter frigidus]|nr:hypothetical protein [Candidatus Stygibacter frigidus]